ncbi:MAG TPA: hypothetical protein VMD79_13210 [Solirubrobacteraceae bacterium]|nr:hypothetical protein [Solirubrobacteraceae bacterium]
MLSELTAANERLALVGLAKNTGKTVALGVLLRELQAQGRRVGVTSVGRDGEERDAIDARIEKPRVTLPAGSLVATTDSLLRASGLAHELLEQTGVRTPLGRVLVARLRQPGAIEVAGPSAASDVRAVADAMRAHGAEQVLIDGAVDRRAASSPAVADGLIVATGAVLDRELEDVVQQTLDAVELARLPLLDAARLASEDVAPVELAPRFVLTAEGEQIAQLLDEHPAARWLRVAGALPERFLRGLLAPLQHRRRELAVVVADPTRVFLWKRGPGWYRRQGVSLHALARTELEAITVNPVAPRSHRFDSAELRARLGESVADVPIFDVLHADYGTRAGSLQT